jgi:hypothetical protein
MTQKAIALSGTIDAGRRLVLDDQLPVKGPARVRVIIILPDDEEIDEATWLRAGAANSAFEFLRDSAEDVYSVSDGRPFHDEG